MIDVWMQHPSPDFLNQAMFASLWRWREQAAGVEVVRVETTLAAMDDAGIDLGLLSAWHGPTGPLISNDEVAALCERFPDRVAGVAAVDLAEPMRAVRELRRCVQDHSFVALRVVPWLWEAAPTDRRYYPLYAACIDLGIPFCTQVRHTGPLRRPRPAGRSHTSTRSRSTSRSW